MDSFAETSNNRLREWRPEMAAEARARISEMIEMADSDMLGLARTRRVEQEVLDLLDEPRTRCSSRSLSRCQRNEAQITRDGITSFLTKR